MIAPAVRELAQSLDDLGLLAWIDEKQLLPGDVVQEILERVVDLRKKSGQQQREEMRKLVAGILARES